MYCAIATATFFRQINLRIKIMARIVLILALLPLVCASQDINVGVLLGPNYNSSIKIPQAHTNTILGYGFAFTYNMEIDKHFSVQLEPGFDQFGYQVKYSHNQNVFIENFKNYRYTFNTLNLPVGLVYSTGRHIKFDLSAGAFYNRVLKAQLDWQNDELYLRTINHYDGSDNITDEVSANNFGCYAGAGMGVMIKEFRNIPPVFKPVYLFGGFRYYRTLNRTEELTSFNADDTVFNLQLRSLQFRLGIQYKL